MEEIYKIKNIDIDESIIENRQEFEALLSSQKVHEIIERVQDRYLPWQEFMYKDWALDNPRKIWSLIKFRRLFGNERTKVRSDGPPYSYDPSRHASFLHQIDMEMGGNFMGIDSFSETDRRKFIDRNLIEEAIASSQLEGANTARQAAKKMLMQGRKPKTTGEKMITNNHAAMVQIETEFKNHPLSMEMLCELHRIVTKDTVATEHQGVLRETFDDRNERLVIKPWDDNVITYTAPDIDIVKKRLPAFFDFANDLDDSRFVHPLIKAIMLHFWVGLLHPFEDGNGRLARIIFYWYMLRKKYWAFSYLPLSEKIKRSPKQYAMAYVYSEQDGHDLNYFIQYNIERLQMARQDFQKYIKKKMTENRQSAQLIQQGYNLNDRQLGLLGHFANRQQDFTSLKEYMNYNPSISKATAALDLRKLCQEGFLEKKKVGLNVYYLPTDKIKEIYK